MADNEIPEYITKLKKQSNISKKLIETIKSAHSTAYTNALKHITTKDGIVDHELLKDSKISDKFIDSMLEIYIESAAKYFDIKPGKDGKYNDFDSYKQDMLLKAYIGTTKTELQNDLKEKGSDYTIEAHEKNRDKLMQEVSSTLKSTSSSHLKDEHLEDLIKYMGAEKFIDHTKITLKEAKTIHDYLYHPTGTVSAQAIKDNLGGKKLYLKDPAYTE